MSVINSAHAFHVMIKPRGSICNLACEYCYFLAKEHLYPGSSFRMSDAVLESYTRQVIDAHQTSEVTFAWQGGEPTLMGLEFFQKAVALQQQYTTPGKRIINALQTNGTMLTNEWCSFFREHNFLIGISIDGPRDLHDVYRVDKGGNPSFGRVMAGLHLLKEHQVEFNVLTTVHAANANHPLDVYRFLRDDIGAEYIQFIPIVEWVDQKNGAVTHRSVTAEGYGRFLVDIFDEWVRHDIGRVSVQIFDVALSAWLGQPGLLCVFAPDCGYGLALEHNGDLYSCDHFVDPDHFVGNILETPLVNLVSSPQQRQFGHLKRSTLPQTCTNCDVRFACHGGCPKNRFSHSSRNSPGLNYLCKGYRAFFTHTASTMQFMANEIRHHRSPENVKVWLAERDYEFARAVANAGRNDPCPCGSGRKVKHCHARPGKR